MIDAEPEIYTYVKDRILMDYPSIYMTNEVLNTPSEFPCISFTEIGNSVYRRTSDSSNIENHVSVTYEFSVYSNLTDGRKRQAKEIASALDTIMGGIGFTRMMLEPIPNIADASVYRIIGRYRAVIDANMTIYRR